jgi:6-bladed beta-propeller
MRRAVLVGFLFSAGACRPDLADPSFTATDSLGVEIVVNRGAPVTNGLVVAIDSLPALVIGSADGSLAEQFFQVVDAVQLRDGQIIVADRGSKEVRVFEASGGHIGTWGGEGDGPGEFRSLARLGRASENVWVYDNALRRVTVFDSSGGLISTNDVGFFELGGREQSFSDVRLVGGELVGLDWSIMSQGEWPGTSLDTAYWAVRSADGLTTQVAQLEGALTVRFEVGGRRVFRLLPLTSVPSWDVADGRLHYTSGATYEIRVATLDGRLVRKIRRDIPRREVDEQARHAWQDNLRRQVRGTQEADQIELFLAAVPMADSLPAYDAIFIDPSGRTWAQRSVRASDPGPVTWDLFGREGRFIAEVETPERFQVTEIGMDHLLGVWRDDNDVEFVQLYRLR